MPLDRVVHLHLTANETEEALTAVHQHRKNILKILPEPPNISLHHQNGNHADTQNPLLFLKIMAKNLAGTLGHQTEQTTRDLFLPLVKERHVLEKPADRLL